MTTKERLHRLVDELSDMEAEDALRLIAARRTEEPDEVTAVALNDDEAQRFLDALDDPTAFESGLRQLAQRRPVLGE